MQTRQRTSGFEERIDAASRATLDATTEVQTSIGAALNTMGSAWMTATNEANNREAQRATLLAAAREYNADLQRFWSNYPDSRPNNSTLIAPQWKTASELAAPSPQGGWAVSGAVHSAFSKDMRGALQAARQASQRMFSGRYRSEAQTAAESALGIVRALEAEADRLGKEREEALKRRETDADAMRASADARLKEAMSSLGDAMRRLPPGMSPWSSPSWLSWTPTFAHSHVLLGMLRPQAGRTPGKNHGFGWDAPTPAFVSVREALRLSHLRQDRETAQALARSLLLRALACTPPGKLRLAVFDPTGLGQSVSSLVELGEYDRDLIGGKVWSSPEDLQRLLAEHVAHIELVIQKYLRAEYATLDEFNAAAGEIAEPYRLLAIFDAPSGFDDRSFAELRRIIENGPRCGVSTLLITDQDLRSPYGVSLDPLPQNLSTVHLKVPFGIDASGQVTEFDLTPETDTSAAEQVVRSIIHGLDGRLKSRRRAPSRLRSRSVSSAGRRWRAANEVSPV